MTPPPDVTTRPLFLQRDFSALWWGQLVSLTGERFTYLALVAMLAEHTHGFRDPGASWMLSLLANVMLAPVLLFAPFVGAWIDRRDLRRVVVVSDLLRAAVVFTIPLVYLATHLVAPVFALLFLLFTCGVFFLPAKSALTPELVSGSQLLAANSWLSAAGIVATAAGALGGGWLVDHYGWTRALFLNAVTYLFSMGTLLVIRGGRRREAVGTGRVGLADYLRQVREGWHVVRDAADVRVALAALSAVWLGGGFLHVAGNLQLQHVAGSVGMSRLGVLLAVLGAAAAASAWWINTAGRNIPRPALLARALLLAAAGLVTFALARNDAGFAVAAALIGFAAAPALMVTETLLQEATSPGLRGRVFSLRDLAVRLVLLGSVTLAGALTRATGERTALLVAGGAVAAVALWVALEASRRALTRAGR